MFFNCFKKECPICYEKQKLVKFCLNKHSFCDGCCQKLNDRCAICRQKKFKLNIISERKDPLNRIYYFEKIEIENKVSNMLEINDKFYLEIQNQDDFLTLIKYVKELFKCKFKSPIIYYNGKHYLKILNIKKHSCNVYLDNVSISKKDSFLNFDFY